MSSRPWPRPQQCWQPITALSDEAPPHPLPTLEPMSLVAGAQLDFDWLCPRSCLVRPLPYYKRKLAWPHPWSRCSPTSTLWPHPASESCPLSRGAQGLFSVDFPVLVSILVLCSYRRDLSSPSHSILSLPIPHSEPGVWGDLGRGRASPHPEAELRLPLQGVLSAALEKCCSGRACPCTPVPATCLLHCCPTTPTWPTASRCEP